MNALQFGLLIEAADKDLAALLALDESDLSLKRALQDVEYLRKREKFGTADRPLLVVRWEQAVKLLREWMAGASSTWGGGSSGGDTSDPTMVAAQIRIYERRLLNAEGELGLLYDSARVLAEILDAWRFPAPNGGERNLRDDRVVVGRAAATMRRIVAMATVPLDLTRLADETKGVPGCVSCARTEGKGAKKVGPHFHAVVDADVTRNQRAAAAGLCGWCYKKAMTDASIRGLPDGEIGDWPPVKACDLYHTRGPEIAGRWMTKHFAALASRLQVAV